MCDALRHLKSAISGCTLCADDFAASKTGHNPRPVVWFSSNARILIAGQAPGARVHESGKPFTDPSGDRLRDWMGVSSSEFYDQERVAILPMAFCFPGYNSRGADLPPPARCADTWRNDALARMPGIALTLLVGGHAQKWHLPGTGTVTDTVADWRAHAPGIFVLPHPSWRNTGWIKRNPWFERELLPALQARVRDVLGERTD